MWRRGRSLLPLEGFAFSRPLLLLQSDDWGRVGIRDREGWEELQRSGMNLGERSYDFYSLETAEDVTAIASLLQKHRDSTGQQACLGMNFMSANVDFARVQAGNFREIFLRPLTAGLPKGWNRPGLFEAYREGIRAGVLAPALHGATHFCRPAAERFLSDPSPRGALLRTLWNAGVPYIYWRMPWIGFEYWDPERRATEKFLDAARQQAMIGSAAETFSEFFSQPPRSACAPGYRANQDTHEAWARCGIRVAQNGPGSARPPHFDRNGILHLYRTIDFEPAVGEEFCEDNCLRAAEECFARGLPAIISVHSINFHSTLKNFRTRTLDLLDHFLSALEAKHPDLLYVRDENLYDLVDTGRFHSLQSELRLVVTKRSFPAARGRAE